MRWAAIAALALAGTIAPASAQEPMDQTARTQVFAELPYWPGYWVSEYTIGTTIGGAAPALAEARERGDTSFFRNFMSLNGGGASWNEEGRARMAEVRATAQGRKADGWGFPMMMNAATPIVFAITPELVIITNSYGETRHIYTDGRPMPDELDMWPTVYGTSVGRWEGDTLVIETRMVTTPSDFFHGAPPYSEDAVYEERLRLEGDRLVGDYTVTDPARLSEPFHTQVSWLRDEGFDRMIQIDWDNDRTSFDGEFNTIEALAVED